MKNLAKNWAIIALFLTTFGVLAQEDKKTESNGFIKDRKFYLNEDGSNYIKFTLLTQAWLRSMDYNPGTTIFGIEKSSGTDIGIRRYRMQFYGQLTDRVFVYSQFGENNYNNISDRKQGFFVHDALGEYALDKTQLSLGIGLTAWSGLSRFASPSVGTILGVDAPLFQQTTNDVTDQFLRKLSIYAKGKLGKFDYRLVMSQPMAIQKSSAYTGVINTNWAFSAAPPKMQWNGYFQYQFKDQESNTTPYMTGTYLGKKKVLNIGAGFIYQKDAMWKLNAVGDTINKNMVHLSVDIYYDAPIGTNGQAISTYVSITHYDFGDNYTRNSGPMNPANGNNNAAILNGSGNNFPMYGTGTIVYGQIGYKLKENLIGKTTLMPYISLQHANYGRLNNSMNFYDVGVNWLLSNHTSKFTLAYQDRPVYNTQGDQITRKGAVIAQYQIYFN
ncbi:conserved exported hypothetical protein [Flavobacterium sp. 9AF]|uniref:hypothetical protein n=1 Tax=Flavobacterium sp. 9AF TaxID=2653142 RepID=UPI0012F2416C|nr:hypothetical protein [Flavobacterium sp. 9AF]VXB06861.1 conserved exported hypothetical protein [Flavobacterium sp. 9AF]